MTTLLRLRLAASSAMLTLLLGAGAYAADGKQVLEDACSACHVQEGGKFARIDSVRKTPEAWDMTVQRMMRNHHLELTTEDRIAVVRYLAETRGLSVGETEDYRYILEREPVAHDTGPNQLMTETCGRCHSYARVALQRRSPDDWTKLVNFHLGQFPTIEYQALARDRDWWGIAQTEIATYLAETYPLGEAPEAAPADLSGAWVLAGRQPGRGDYSGTLALKASGDGYDVTMRLDFADGSETYDGSGILIGAGEWRATLKSGNDKEIRQVFALKADGSLEGRWFLSSQDVTGGRIAAVREDAEPRILSVSPAYLRKGEATELTVSGTNLPADPVLPEGVTGEVVSASPGKVVLKLRADTSGNLPIALGDVSASSPLVVFEQLDRITIVPELAMSRVGGGGGPIPKTPAQFEAVGWLNGPDGQAGTDDDIRVGYFPAIWTTDNFDEAAAAMEDVKYAGTIDENGLFTPSDAGPNLERPMMANNVGNLKVVATVDDAGRKLTAEAHLYATVQRFVDALIR